MNSDPSAFTPYSPFVVFEALLSRHTQPTLSPGSVETVAEDVSGLLGLLMR